ncbi:MAG: PIN domain-containing protein [Steroidobacteraceae bacterium]|jgi:PIN domain nuclease of toxin-antitoxin system|nr:PIN domain-containing protein [Steroidobacteraceae bacterium]
MLNLDTHVLLHAVGGELTRRERQLLENDSWSVSGIVLWEIAKLDQLGRIELDLESPDVRRALAAVHAWPITVEVASAIARRGVRVDPADEPIAATSIVHGASLLTRDRKLLASKRVPLAR